MENCPTYYIESIKNMNRAVVRGYTAPHKPILLLAILELVEEGKIASNKIDLTDALIDRFTSLWVKHVDDGSSRDSKMEIDKGLEIDVVIQYPYKCSIANPYFHMNHEPFWNLIPSDKYVKRSDYTVNGLKTCFLYAEIDQTLFDLMKDKKEREEIRRWLVSTL